MHEWHIRRHGQAAGLCAHIKELLEAEGRRKRSVLQAATVQHHSRWNEELSVSFSVGLR